MKAVPFQRLSMAPVDQPPPLASTTAFAAAAIAHGNSIYVATWADADGVFVQRITNQGIAIDTQPIKIAADRYSSRPDIAWNGRSFLVVWIANGGVAAATVDEAGVVSQPNVVAPNGSMEPRIAWNGKVFLLVYGVPQPCYFECIPQRAATYAVRIAADGTALDMNPAIIDRELPSDYYVSAASRATVASNGSDFLVALDKSTGASVVNVKADGLSIAVGEPKGVFAWFTFVINDIRWNGHECVLASRYSSGTKQWMALTHLTPNGDPLSRVVTEIINSQPASVPSLAANAFSEDAVVITESTGDPPVSRAHVFFDADFALSPLPPAAPTNVTAIGTSANFTMTWNVGPDADGVVIETAFGRYSSFSVVPTSDHSHTFSTPGITSVTLRALNAGGLSQAIGALLQTPARRRATRGR